MNSFSFEAIGTSWTIDVSTDISKNQLEKIKVRLFERIEVYDATYSRFRADSLITKIAKQEGTYDFPDDAGKLIGLYKNLYSLTNGTFTPLIGNVLVDAGYDATYSLQTKKLTTPPSWNETLQFNDHTLITNKPVTLDFGAGGKGYLIDIIGELLRTYGVDEFCIDGSGDFLYAKNSHDPLQIALEHPTNPKQAIGVATITGGSLCGSAGNRRTWGDFHHIVSPHTLTSPKNILAVWVTARQALLADCISTALFLVDQATLTQEYQFEYAYVDANFNIHTSENFPGEFFYR